MAAGFNRRVERQSPALSLAQAATGGQTAWTDLVAATVASTEAGLVAIDVAVRGVTDSANQGGDRVWLEARLLKKSSASQADGDATVLAQDTIYIRNAGNAGTLPGQISQIGTLHDTVHDTAAAGNVYQVQVRATTQETATFTFAADRTNSVTLFRSQDTEGLTEAQVDARVVAGTQQAARDTSTRWGKSKLPSDTAYTDDIPGDADISALIAQPGRAGDSTRWGKAKVPSDTVYSGDARLPPAPTTAGQVVKVNAAGNAYVLAADEQGSGGGGGLALSTLLAETTLAFPAGADAGEFVETTADLPSSGLIQVQIGNGATEFIDVATINALDAAAVGDEPDDDNSYESGGTIPAIHSANFASDAEVRTGTATNKVVSPHGVSVALTDDVEAAALQANASTRWGKPKLPADTLYGAARDKVPASTQADANKVLTVDSAGTPGWETGGTGLNQTQVDGRITALVRSAFLKATTLTAALKKQLSELFGWQQKHAVRLEWSGTTEFDFPNNPTAGRLYDTGFNFPLSTDDAIMVRVTDNRASFIDDRDFFTELDPATFNALQFSVLTDTVNFANLDTTHFMPFSIQLGGDNAPLEFALGRSATTNRAFIAQRSGEYEGFVTFQLGSPGDATAAEVAEIRTDVATNRAGIATNAGHIDTNTRTASDALAKANANEQAIAAKADAVASGATLPTAPAQGDEFDLTLRQVARIGALITPGVSPDGHYHGWLKPGNGAVGYGSIDQVAPDIRAIFWGDATAPTPEWRNRIVIQREVGSTRVPDQIQTGLGGAAPATSIAVADAVPGDLTYVTQQTYAANPYAAASRTQVGFSIGDDEFDDTVYDPDRWSYDATGKVWRRVNISGSPADVVGTLARATGDVLTHRRELIRGDALPHTLQGSGGTGITVTANGSVRGNFIQIGTTLFDVVNTPGVNDELRLTLRLAFGQNASNASFVAGAARTATRVSEIVRIGELRDAPTFDAQQSTIQGVLLFEQDVFVGANRVGTVEFYLCRADDTAPNSNNLGYAFGYSPVSGSASNPSFQLGPNLSVAWARTISP